MPFLSHCNLSKEEGRVKREEEEEEGRRKKHFVNRQVYVNNTTPLLTLSPPLPTPIPNSQLPTPNSPLPTPPLPSSFIFEVVPVL
jgi:hypothetical protein